jgi:hypothetical protein
LRGVYLALLLASVLALTELAVDMHPDPPLVDTLIFDLGDVLFSWSAITTSSITPRTLKAILDTATWHDYECSRIDQQTCYERCAVQFGVASSEIRDTFDQARASLVANERMIALIRQLRAERPELRVFAMSNISVSPSIH